LKEHFIGEKIMEKFSKERIAELRKEPWVFGAYIIHQRYNDALSEIERLQAEVMRLNALLVDAVNIYDAKLAERNTENASLRELVEELIERYEKYAEYDTYSHVDSCASNKEFGVDCNCGIVDACNDLTDTILSAKELLNNGKT